jgi:hypothetical protein
VPGGSYGVQEMTLIEANREGMDQISIKTPSPKCCLYWRLIEFIDWRYSKLCLYFRPFLRTSAPRTPSLVHIYPSTPLSLSDRGPQTDKHLPPSIFTGQFLRKANI